MKKRWIGDGKEQQMAKKKYYAVKQGKTPGVYDTWEACKMQVEGVSGAIYKSFPTREEARIFAGIEEQDVTQEEIPVDGAVAYVDGSYNVQTGEYSCGVVFFYKGEEIHLAKKGESDELAQMRNVAGEILGAEMAMKEAVERGADRLTIYHDYQGIASWCLGDWKTNKEGTKAYKSYFDSIKDKIVISFVKVKGHSGDKWNDLADELAKSVIFQ
jgi:ribonuclease HI